MMISEMSILTFEMDTVIDMKSCLLVIMKVEIVKNMNSRLLMNMKVENVKTVLFLVKFSCSPSMIHQSPSSHVHQAAPVVALILSFAKIKDCIDRIYCMAIFNIGLIVYQIDYCRLDYGSAAFEGIIDGCKCSVNLVAFTVIFVN